MVVAVAMVHRHVAFFMNWSGQQKGEGYEFHVLMLAIMVVLMIGGGGAWSADGALSKES
jgi:putative oxidoreductase